MQNNPNHTNNNVVLSTQKAYKALFTKVRNVETHSADFVFYSKRIMRLLAEDAVAELPHDEVTIATPCAPSLPGLELLAENNVCAVSIIRAGDSLMESVREILPRCKIGKILIQRDESSKEKKPKLFYVKLPENIKDMHVILCDPMLATGGSAVAALEVLIEQYGVAPDKVIFANVISCPEGIEHLKRVYPLVKIVTACVDECLNEEKYIVPGLGDYGDRFFNSL